MKTLAAKLLCQTQCFYFILSPGSLPRMPAVTRASQEPGTVCVDVQCGCRVQAPEHAPHLCISWKLAWKQNGQDLNWFSSMDAGVQVASQPPCQMPAPGCLSHGSTKHTSPRAEGLCRGSRFLRSTAGRAGALWQYGPSTPHASLHLASGGAMASSTFTSQALTSLGAPCL